jgi:hypothetical protein
MLVKIPRNDSTTVVAALAKQIGKLPDELQRSLTWDQSKEMAAPVLRGYVTIRHTVKAAGRGNAATSITATGEGAQGREVGERRHLGRQPGHRAAA